jgi:parvulin-like peptidyl-prolyl isomerase
MRLAILLGSSLWLAACATGAPTAPAAPAAATSPPATALPAPVPPAGPILARVGDQAISAGVFRQEMERRGGKIPGRFATPEQRRALLDELIGTRAVLAAARAAGYDRDPEFVATVERMLAARYLDEHLDARLAAIEISKADLEAFYREHASEFVVPTRARGAWILLEVPRKATPEKVEEARVRAESVRAEALVLPPATRNLGPVALRHSDDSGTRYIGGEFGWVTAGEAEGFRYGREIVDSLLALGAAGEVSPVLRVERGFAIVKLVEREEEAPAPLEKIAPGIRNRLIKERREALREAFYADLLRGLPVTVDAQALAEIEPLSPPAAVEPTVPPPLPGGN